MNARKQKEWDIYYMRLARLVGEKSKCLSRKIGSVLVKDNSILSTGYNRPARGIPPSSYRDDSGKYKSVIQSLVCPRQRMGYGSGQGIEYCAAVHSEVNTVVQAARNGVSTKDSTLYCWCGVPCPNCSKELINAGVKRIVCTGYNDYFNGNGINSLDMLRQAGVEVNYIYKEEIDGI